MDANNVQDAEVKPVTPTAPQPVQQNSNVNSQSSGSINLDVKDLFSKKVLVTTLIFLVVGAIFKFLEIIPVLGVLFMILVYFIFVFQGFFLNYVHELEGNKDKVLDGIKYAVVGALIAGLAVGIVDAIIPRTYGPIGFAFTYTTPFFTAVFGGLLSALIGNVVGSLLATFVEKKYIPQPLIDLTTKVKTMAK